MHVQLWRENVEKMSEASASTNKSVNELVNLIISAVAVVEIVDQIKVTVKVKDVEKPRKVYKVRTGWVHRF